MQARTTQCSLLGHPEFLVTYDEHVIPADEVRLFLQGLEDSVAEGERYAPGQTLQVGWMVVSLREGPGGLLEILEPDMAGLPMNYVPSITSTLHYLRTERYTAESVGLEEMLLFPTLRHSAIVCSQPGKLGFFLDRGAPDGHGSGWFVGCNDPEHEHNDPDSLAFKSLYELGCRFPFLIDFLALPAKTAVSIDAGVQLELSFDGKPLTIKSGSYLADKYGA